MQGRAKIEKIEGKLAQFKVEGESVYHASLSYEPKRDSFLLDCNCPYFESSFNCKHLWASVLEADRMRLYPVL
ncbi:SWIM zinc finger family protein, partial [Pseudomonas aeruginosa]